MSGKVIVGGVECGYISGVQAKIEKIGDRFGLVLPKELLDACGFGSEATVTVQDKTLVVSPSPHRPREGWAEALAQIPQEELDRDFAELQAFRETPNRWDETEWQWPDSHLDEKV
jgi:antitoxin component of MazEF toxin-antitoxin module